MLNRTHHRLKETTMNRRKESSIFQAILVLFIVLLAYVIAGNIELTPINAILNF